MEAQLRKIRFRDYEKFFKDALSSPDVNNIIFYKRTADHFEISFSWDNFIIFTQITISKILDMYKDSFPDTIEVSTSQTGEHPAIIKFKEEYLQRGIPEQ